MSDTGTESWEPGSPANFNRHTAGKVQVVHLQVASTYQSSFKH